jgi:hypothetical protein
MLTEDSAWLAELASLYEGDSPIFNDSVVMEWIQGFRKWAHFNNEFYRPLREKEQRLAIRLAEQSVAQSAKMLIALPLHDDHPVSDDEIAFQSIGSKIREIWKKALADQLVDRFSKKDGIGLLWGKDKAFLEKELLFESNPYFHINNIYLRLEAIAQQAAEVSMVQENFLEFMRMLLYAALDLSSGFSHEQELEILKNERFREICWRAATCQRIHRRSMGSLLERRKAFIKKTELYNAFPIPSWVGEMEPDLLEAHRVDHPGGQNGLNEGTK